MFSPENTLVIRNPVSGRFFSRRRAAKLEKILEARGYTIVHTQRPQHATRLAKEFAESEYGLIIIGGDGTVMEAVQELRYEVPIALFPTGTVNLLARALQIPTKIQPWLDLLKQKTFHEAYGAKCNDKVFLSVISTGLTAQAVEKVNPILKKWIQEVAYGIAAFIGYFRYRNPIWAMELDGEGIDYPVLGAVMGLGPFYGGPNVIYPNADIQKPEIDVCVLRGQHKIWLWQYVFGMLTGRLSAFKKPVYRKAKHVKIVADPPMSVETDGDFYGYTPVEIQVDSQPRRFLAPLQV